MRLLSTRLLAPRYDALRHAYLRLLYGPSRAPLARAPNFRRALSRRENFFLPPPPASAIYVWTVSRSSRAIVPLRRTRGRELDRIMLLDEQEEDPKRGPIESDVSVERNYLRGDNVSPVMSRVRSRACLLQAMMQRVAPSRPYVQFIRNFSGIRPAIFHTDQPLACMDIRSVFPVLLQSSCAWCRH